MTSSTPKTVFVTGATGFIGSRLIPRLLQRGHTITALVRRPERAGHLRALGVRLVPGDVTQPGGLAEAMRGADWLLHLANHYSLHERDERVYTRVNVEGNRNVMRAALEAGVGKVIHVSSGVSYGVSPDQPLREDSRVGLHPNAYWRTKHAGDEEVWRLYRQGLPVVMLYPGGVVGPDDPNATGTWIRRLVRQRQFLRAFEASGFTYVHVDDVAESIVRAAEWEGNAGERYLIGQEFLTNRAFVELVAELSGRSVPPVVLPDRLAHTSAAFLGGLERLTGLPPFLGFTPNSARHLAAGFRFGSDKAEWELGLRYTPVRQALLEDIATFHTPARRSAWVLKRSSPACLRTSLRPTLLALLALGSGVASAHTGKPAPLSSLPRPAGQYGLPFAAPPGPDTWLLGQFYGNTPFAYQERRNLYQNGQGVHFGLDFSAPCGTPVVAIASGVVSEVDGPHGSAPHNLVINHPDGLSSLYGHLLKKASVKVGQKVGRGEVVALSGDSQGTCLSEPHLHLELRDHSHQILLNPVGYFAADWATLGLVDPDMDGASFQQDLRQPGVWQWMDDQPTVRLHGPLLNNFPQPWPPLVPATPGVK